MLIKMIRNAVKNWGAPSNWHPEMGVCGALPTAYEKGPGGAEFWVSAWEPTPEDLALLNAGGSIHLGVSANVYPVVFMRVHLETEPEDDGQHKLDL